ncbi:MULTISPECIES: CinA family protein [Thermocrispum]|nr:MULTISPECIES: CinA family protein [Thermocrispum]
MSELAEGIVARLRARGETVATAESLTGGGLCAELTAVPGASDVVRGGLIVYTDQLKIELAGVPRDLLTRAGAVDADVAAYLAAGARARCHADWGIGLTGVAGPGPADGVPAGTVYVGIADAETSSSWRLQLSGDRAAVRRATIEHALRLLGEHLSR